jgi:hypothetical protein
MLERVCSEGVSEEVLTVLQCGPNQKCEHVMDHYIDLTDESGRVCGVTPSLLEVW